MIENLTYSQFLKMLAHWFDMQQMMGQWPGSDSHEVQNRLLVIADKVNVDDDFGPVNLDNE